MDRIDAIDDGRGSLLFVDSSVGSVFLVDGNLQQPMTTSMTTGDPQRLPRPRNFYGDAVALNEITGFVLI